METAPRNGEWILLEGEFAGGDTTSIIIASYQPHACKTGIYEWMTLDSIAAYVGDDWREPALPEWNWYCEGRASGWLPLSVPKSAPHSAKTGKTTPP